MQVQQLSVFVENKSGRLAEIAEIIAGAGADIRALTVADTSDFGILRLIVDKPQIAAQALRDADMTVSITSVIMMGLSDQPGAFAQAMRTLAENHVSVENVRLCQQGQRQGLGDYPHRRGGAGHRGAPGRRRHHPLPGGHWLTAAPKTGV